MPHKVMMSREIFAQLFFDIGNGFNENDSIKIPIGFGDIKIEFDISEIRSIKNLRLDPVNIPCVISQLNISYKNHKNEKLPLGYYLIGKGDLDGDEFLFFHSDPIFIINWDSSIETNTINVSFYNADSVDILTKYRNLVFPKIDSSLEFHLEEIKRLSKSTNAKVSAFDGEINYQQTQISKIKQHLSSLEKFESHLQKIQEISPLDGNLESSPKQKSLNQKDKQLEKLMIEKTVCQKEAKKLNRKLSSLEKRYDKVKTLLIRAETLLEAKGVEFKNTTNSLSAEIKILSEEKKSLLLEIETLTYTKNKHQILLKEIETLTRHI